MIDNREAMAYLVFRRFNCSRAEALAMIDELGEHFQAVRRIASKRWRSRPREARKVDPVLLGLCPQRKAGERG